MTEFILHWILAVPRALSLGFSAMAFESRAFVAAGVTGNTRDLALLTAFLAGVSQAVGHGVVLFLNRIPFPRFVLSIFLMASIYVASAVVTAVSTKLAAQYAFGRDIPYWPMIGVIALAQAPRLLGVFTLAPYFGDGLSRVLDVWVLALILFGLHHGAGIPVEIAVMAALLGWIAVRLLWFAFGRPLGRLVAISRQYAAGGVLSVDAHNVVEFLKAKARGGAKDAKEPGE